MRNSECGMGESRIEDGGGRGCLAARRSRVWCGGTQVRYGVRNRQCLANSCADVPYREAVKQHSPGLAALSGLPWVRRNE